MPSIDPYIALRTQNPDFEPRENALLRALKMRTEQQQYEAGQEKLANDRSDRNELNAMARLVVDPQYQREGRFDLERGTSALYGAAPNKAAGFIKGLQEQQKTAVETGNKRAEMNQHQWKLMGTMARVLAADPRPETANALFDQWEGLTGQKAGPWRTAVAGAQSPEQIRELALRVDLDAKDQLASFETRNTGGSTDTIRRDPVTGQVVVVNSVQNTQSPDNKATNARIAADNAESRAQAERHWREGQNTPHYMETEGGLVALPKKLQPGQAPTATPVMGPDGKQLTGAKKPMTGPVLKQLQEVRDQAATLDGLFTSFQPNYASKGVLGLGAEASLAAKAVMGKDKDSVDWWKNYRKQSELVERHALFGASLTQGEQDAWRSADIGPGMNPEVIERNLRTRAALTKRILENTRQDLIDAGQSADRVNAIANRRGAGAQPTQGDKRPTVSNW